MSDSTMNTMKEVPKNASWFRLFVKQAGEVKEYKAHYACDLSGEEQPAFEGFFYEVPSMKGFQEVPGTPIGWLPIPPGSPAGIFINPAKYTREEIATKLASGSINQLQAEEMLRENAMPEPVPTEGAVPPVFNKDRQLVDEVSKLPFSRRYAIYRNIKKTVICTPAAPEAAAAPTLVCDECPFENNCPECPQCKLPPAGWLCTRGVGHKGPCAAIPIEVSAAPIAPAAEVLAKRIEDLRVVHQNTVRYWEHECAKLDAEKVAAEELIQALEKALTELVDSIEDAGGHDEDGDVFDIRRACAALARAESYRKGAKNAGH